MSKTPFKETLVYPVLFMLLTCIVFVGVLAVMFRTSEAKIEAYRQDSYRKIVLGLFAEPLAEALQTKPFHLLESYQETYTAYVKESPIPGLERKVFSAVVADSVLGYCVDIGGKGLWGSMRALIALSPDMQNLQGIAIYEQVETPGLGARIGEKWFMDQFSQIKIISADGSEGDYTQALTLIPEGQVPANKFQVQQITGATITTVSVLKMIKDEMNQIYAAKLKQDQL